MRWGLLGANDKIIIEERERLRERLPLDEMWQRRYAEQVSSEPTCPGSRLHRVSEQDCISADERITSQGGRIKASEQDKAGAHNACREWVIASYPGDGDNRKGPEKKSAIWRQSSAPCSVHPVLRSAGVSFIIISAINNSGYNNHYDNGNQGAIIIIKLDIFTAICVDASGSCVSGGGIGPGTRVVKQCLQKAH